jgi:hypothetical protein
MKMDMEMCTDTNKEFAIFRSGAIWSNGAYSAIWITYDISKLQVPMALYTHSATS